MIKAEIVKDSVSVAGARITTFVLTYPRFIHAEFMTHRMISKNASSSRAIPTAKFIEEIDKNPAMPTAFTKNCAGMQAKETVEEEVQDRANELWLRAKTEMLYYAQELSKIGVHKQHANRLLEPFQHMVVVCTATDYANFFALRTHKDAQPEFQQLAKAMFKAFSESNPQVLQNGEWHLPFIPADYWGFKTETIEEMTQARSEVTSGYTIDEICIRRSVARCARVSYNNHDGTSASVVKDLELYNRLVGGSPIHASPTEHQAMAIPDKSVKSGNLTGWIQYRKTLSNENITTFSGPEEVE